MAFLLAEGALTAIFLVIGLIISIIGLFMRKITVFDSIAIGIILGILSYSYLHIHPAFALLIGIGVIALLSWIQSTKYGFWILAIPMSLLWGFIFCFFAYAFTNKDLIWTYVVFGLGSALMMGLHLKARND